MGDFAFPGFGQKILIRGSFWMHNIKTELIINSILIIKINISHYSSQLDLFLPNIYNSNSNMNQKDPTILECCLEEMRQPYIGVDANCDKSAIFCLEHSSHQTSEGLMHQMMPLKHFKRTVHSKKFFMQEKIRKLIQTYNSFMENLINQIRELQLKKSLELSMLWLRELAENEEEYELMRKIYRMDFSGLTCQDVNSVYYKIIHNEELQRKNVQEMNCYKGICNILDKLSNNLTANEKIVQKVAQIQGMVEDGRILRKVLPDRRVVNSKVREILLEQGKLEDNYNIRYHQAEMSKNSSKYYSVFSKYPLLSHTTYHISIKTKYTNIMVGVCGEKVKEIANKDLHYDTDSVVYNCSNGCVYFDGQFKSGVAGSFTKNCKELIFKMKLTSDEMILTTNKEVIARQPINNIAGKIYLHLLARTKGDFFEIQRDKDLSSDNIELENADVMRKEQPEIVIERQEEKPQRQMKPKPNRVTELLERQNNRRQRLDDIVEKYKAKRPQKSEFLKKSEEIVMDTSSLVIEKSQNSEELRPQSPVRIHIQDSLVPKKQSASVFRSEIEGESEIVSQFSSNKEMKVDESFKFLQTVQNKGSFYKESGGTLPKMRQFRGKSGFIMDPQEDVRKSEGKKQASILQHNQILEKSVEESVEIPSRVDITDRSDKKVSVQQSSSNKFTFFNSDYSQPLNIKIKKV